MANYTLEEKDSFTVLGFGTSLRVITQTMLVLIRKRQTFGKLSIKMEGLIN